MSGHIVQRPKPARTEPVPPGYRVHIRFARARGEGHLRKAQKDPRAFDDFYRTHEGRVLRFVASRALDGQLTYDIVAETFAKALEHRGDFRGRDESAEQAWLFTIASRELHRFWRRGKIEREAVRRLDINCVEMNEPELELLERRIGLASIADVIYDRLHQLPEDQREAIEMRVVDELGYDEIAERLGVTAQVVRARVSRGLRELASGLKDAGVTAEDYV